MRLSLQARLRFVSFHSRRFCPDVPLRAFAKLGAGQLLFNPLSVFLRVNLSDQSFNSDKHPGHLAMKPNTSNSSRVMSTLLGAGRCSCSLVHDRSLSCDAFYVHSCVVFVVASRNRHEHIQVASLPTVLSLSLWTILVGHTPFRHKTMPSPVVVSCQNTRIFPHARQLSKCTSASCESFHVLRVRSRVKPTRQGRTNACHPVENPKKNKEKTNVPVS